MAGAKVPSVKLSSGASIPVIGLGTWKSKPGEVKQAVKDAIDVGYRHFDCAWIYGNENEIGEAFSEKIKEGAVKREDLFVTSKVWNSFHSKAAVQRAIGETLASLQLEYIDLYIIHWPMSYEEGGDKFPKDSSGKRKFGGVDFTETWKGLEEVQKSGKAKSIGLSNFNVEQIKRVQQVATLPISCNQIEVHVYLQNKELVDFCQQNKITVVAYSPLGSYDRPRGADANTGEYPPPLEDATVVKIAEKHKKQPGQVLLKFLLQRNLVVIPKSVKKERMKANLESFDFQLDENDMKQLDALDKKGEVRACTMDSDWDSKDHPFPHSGKGGSGSF